MSGRTGSFTGTGLGRKAKLRLWERDGGKCHLCGEPVNNIDDASRDHIVPLSRGGCTCTGNIALAHRGCNSRRGSMQLWLTGKRDGHKLSEHKG